VGVVKGHLGGEWVDTLFAYLRYLRLGRRHSTSQQLNCASTVVRWTLDAGVVVVNSLRTIGTREFGPFGYHVVFSSV